jgi:hypothetical protein
MSRLEKPETIGFSGKVLAVKARIRLMRSFDQVSHQYQGYVLVLQDDEALETVRRIAIGPSAHAKHQFRIGDRVSGTAHRVPDPATEWAEFYRVSGLRLEQRGPKAQQRPPDPEGGIAVPLDVYRANGHRRLDAKTCAEQCARCPWGLTMATEIILDQWNPSKRTWRFETHCYGPRGCPRYTAGPPRRVPGRKPGMVWIDDDVERERLRHGG